MPGQRAFNEGRPSDDPGETGRTEGNAEISPYIEDLYMQLLEFDFTYEQLYEMTVKELIDTLIAKRKGLGYRLWKQSYLIAWAVMGKQFPRSPEKASPELFPKKPTIKMPSNLLKEHLKSLRGDVNYE
ncbi:MAG: hypothetical protein IJF87_06055 [Erysipelotrichaceae bacterium]|nr:hypothetical protein [Erysipelotrichaceae bacterium]